MRLSVFLCVPFKKLEHKLDFSECVLKIGLLSLEWKLRKAFALLNSAKDPPVMAECKAKAKAELFIFCAETFKREISLHGLAAQVLPDVCVYTLHICIEFSC